MHKSIQYSLGQNQEDGDSDDGLELGVCRISEESSELIYAGARFSLFKVQGENYEEIKGDKSGVGYRGIPIDRAFTNHIIKPSGNDCFMMMSDGITDQIGGEKRRGLGKKRFLKLFASIQKYPLHEQKDLVLNAFAEHQGNETRRDDVSVIGFKIRGE